MKQLSVEIQSLIVFLSEIVFLYLKTINIQAISKGKVLLAIVSNSAVSITWLIGVTISINSLLNNHYTCSLLSCWRGNWNLSSDDQAKDSKWHRY